MTSSTAPPLAAQEGFSLAELLVVTLIIGALALIALPQFLGQQEKGHDAAAKQDARNVAGAMESCFAGKEDYRSCTSAGDLRDAGATFGGAGGEVEVDAPAVREYTITAHSRSGTDFVLVRVSGGGQERTCTRSGHGGCGAAGGW